MNKLTRKLNGRTRRGVAEIITTLLLVGITVIGALVVASFFAGTGGGAGIGSVVTSIEKTRESIKLTGYDARDGSNLSGILVLDNHLDRDGNGSPELCAGSGAGFSNCSGSPNSLPSAGGTEFLVLKIRNISLATVTLAGVIVNNATHSWDDSKAGLALSGTNFPAAGKFSLVNADPADTAPTQRSNTDVGPGLDLRVVVKLSTSLSPDNDFDINESLKIQFDYGALDIKEFIVIVGVTR